MNWFTKLFTSSIGRKVIMSLTGLFLIVFLVVHLIGNFQLLAGDGGESFNAYAEFMITNPAIKAISIGLYVFIILHAIQGIALVMMNKKSRPVGYRMKKNKETSWASRQMGILGLLILAFLFLHMGDFWFKAKFGELPIDAWGHDDLYYAVSQSFSQWWIVAAYLVSMVVLALHLWHGFASAFQTLGINHPKWTPVIQFIGKAYAILIPIGFAIIPLLFIIQNN